MSLPEKDLFTLVEVISRWRFANCDEATMLDYARRDLLVFSVYLRDLGDHRTIEKTASTKITTTHTTVFAMVSPTYEWKPIRYLRADDARRILEARSGEEVAVTVLYSSPMRTEESGTGYLSALYFTRADLLITREERDRFEASHKINLSSGRVAKFWAWLRNSENQKALSVLGAALAAVVGAGWAMFTWWQRGAPGL